ncbi:tRNA (N6-isopentenyl adenosine(37)-C2)-methylthiotransferase MiaB [Lachnospiraceae bacterium]|jgi:hypothetical protein|nr:tRNA (N6-isopentenyl adenosine(37)-C2)-methylthiotransferase MiaB [Lachnospiraceae bacterium]
MAEEQKQRLFIEQLKQVIEERAAKKGSPVTCHITTMGCQMNARDSEKLSGILSEIGCREIESEDADILLFNTCTVRENANEKLYGHLGIVKHFKKEKKDMLIGICGCMMQEQDEVLRIRTKYRFVDLVFGTHNIWKFPELLYACTTERQRVIDVEEETDDFRDHMPVRRKTGFKSGVNIMYGCNNFCSYCIVPYVRGREKSREPEDIIREIRALVKDGVKEIMLLGQNVNSYGKTLDLPVSFADLLRRICRIDGLLRVRFMTPHPKDLSDDLILAIRENPKVCRHIHLPLQSGSTRILKRMNRCYTKESYLSLVKRIRTLLPEIGLTTDVIVGFPGETEEDFQDTLDVVSRCEFQSAFTFVYSKRTGTPAAAFEDQVPPDVVSDRMKRLIDLVQSHASRVADRDQGTIAPVLVEEKDRHRDGYLTGRLGNNLMVHFPGEEAWIGQMVDVELVESKGFYYMGIRRD